MSTFKSIEEMSQERAVKLAEEVWARSYRERDTLIAAYIRENPDVPVSEIVLTEQRCGNLIRWSVGRQRKRTETDG